MQPNLFTQLLEQLSPELINPIDHPAITQVMVNGDGQPLSTYLEFRLSDDPQIDLTNTYALLSTANIPAVELSGLDQLITTFNTLPLHQRSLCFGLEYDHCQTGLTTPGIHLSLDDSKLASTSDVVESAAVLVDMLFGATVSEPQFKQDIKAFVAAASTLGSVGYLSKLTRNGIDTIKIFVGVCCDDVIALLSQVGWQGPINQVKQILDDLQAKQCVENTVHFDFSITPQQLLPSLGIYLSEKAMTNKATFYQASQSYLTERLSRQQKAAQKTEKLFAVLSTQMQLWCDFKIFINNNSVTYKAYLGIPHNLESQLDTLTEGLAKLFTTNSPPIHHQCTISSKKGK